MAKYECDGKDSCTTQVDVGDANPSFVICAECNHGQAMFNCVDSGNHSCDCKACGPQFWSNEVHEPMYSPPDDYDENADTIDTSLEDDDIPF